MKHEFPIDINRVNLLLSWVSIFILSWLLLFKRLEVNITTVFFFCFFILVALGSWFGTAIEERQNQIQKEKDKNVK